MAINSQIEKSAELERLLAGGGSIGVDTITSLLESDDEDLGLLASYLLAGREEQILPRIAAGPGPLLRRLARRHGAELLRRLDLPERLRAAILAEQDAEEPARALPAAMPGERSATMTIVVHGAFAAGDSWWRPTGVFGRYIHSMTGNLYQGSDYYRWSGGGFHPARVEAARQLVEWVRLHPADELDIISHSHGGNICFLATQMGIKVRKLISLATPICLDYLPDLRQIGILHNVLSLADIIQGPASYIGVSHRGDGRSLADSKRVINHLATLDDDGHAPSHSELHDPATWKASGLEAKLLGPGSFPPKK